MAVLKPGTRLRSLTCTTEVVVVRGDGDVDLRCGGEPMVDIGNRAGPTGRPKPGFDGGTQIGKRYGSQEVGLEVLCTKPGAGSLSVGDTLLDVQGAKPLPASD